MKLSKLTFHTVTLALLVGLVNCTPTQTTRKRSFADDQFTREEIEQVSLAQADLVDEILAVVTSAETVVEKQSLELTTNRDQQLLMQKVIIPLRDYVLNLDFMLDPNHRILQTRSGRPVLNHAVQVFNRALIMLYESNPSLINNETDILAKYKDIIFWDCDQELQGTCVFIKFYQNTDSNQIVRIVKMIHDQETDSDEKLRLVKAAVDLKNRRLDASLRFMLLERLADSFSNLNRDEGNYRLRRDSDLFANILKMSVDDSSPHQFYRDLIAQINPLALSRKIDDPKNPAMSELIRMGGRFLIYQENGQITDTLRKVINDSRCALGSGYEQGVEFQIENIRGHWKSVMDGETSFAVPSHCQDVINEISNNPEADAFNADAKAIEGKLLNGMDFSSSDEYDFLVHQIYFGHYNMEDGDAFWQFTNKDQNKFLASIIKLIKLQVAHTIVFTNNRMNDFYNNNPNSKLVELLSESDREASKIRKAWSITIDRVKLIKNFAGRVMDKAPAQALKDYNDLKAISLAVEKNIKFYVTYPNMIPLLHYMATLDLVETFQSYFGPVTIDSNDVIWMYFSGRFAPWFNFGNDGVALDQVELMYAFYFTIMTETFETYASNSKVTFTYEEFFNIAIKKMLFANEDFIRKKIDELEEVKQKNLNNLAAVKNMCDEETQLRKNQGYDLNDSDYDWRHQFVNDVKAKPRKKIVSVLPFHNLGTLGYDGTNSGAGKPGKLISDLLTGQVPQIFDRMYSTFHEQNAQALILMEIYQKYVGDKIGLDSVVKKQFAEFERLKAEFAKLYFSLYDDYKDCSWAFREREEEIRAAVVFKEAQYWGKTFDLLVDFLQNLSEEERQDLLVEKAEEDLTENDKQFREIKKEIQAYTQNPPPPASQSYPVEYTEQWGFNNFTPDRVTTYKMDAFTRLVSHFQELFPGQYSIEYPSNFEKLEFGIYEKSEPLSLSLNWSQIASNRELAKENFIRAGVQAFARKVGWVDHKGWPTEFGSELNLLITLYKLDRISLDPAVDCYQKEVEDNQELFAQKCKVTPVEEIMKNYTKIINRLNINARDAELLSLLGRKEKVIETVYNDYIKKDGEHRLYSIYDLLMKRVITDGKVLDSPEAWFQTYLVRFSKSMNQMKSTHLLFPFDEGVEEIFVNRYSKWISNYFTKVRSFLESIKDLPDMEPMLFRYHLDRSFMLGEKQGNGPFEPYIQRNEYNKFINHIDSMNNDSNQYFREVLLPKKTEFIELNQAE